MGKIPKQMRRDLRNQIAPFSPSIIDSKGEEKRNQKNLSQLNGLMVEICE